MIEVKVQRMYRFETDRSLKAFADIAINDSLLIKGLSVIDGEHGLFVSMPREQAKDKKWYESIRCLTNNVKEQISDIVLYAYQNEE